MTASGHSGGAVAVVVSAVRWLERLWRRRRPVGGLMARRVQDWQKSHQGLGAGISACMDARKPTPRRGRVVQQEDKYGRHLHARVLRRRSTGEDERERGRVCVCRVCVWIEILHSYICVLRLAQLMQPAQAKKTPPEVSCHVGYRDGKRWVSNRSAP